MLPVLGWRIYRADGSTYSSSTHDIKDVPDGIQIVIWFHPTPYRTIDCGEDIYSVDGRILNGELMDTDAYYALLAQAVVDEVWP